MEEEEGDRGGATKRGWYFILFLIFRTVLFLGLSVFFHRKYEHGGPVRKRLRFSSTHWPLRSNDVNSIQWRT